MKAPKYLMQMPMGVLMGKAKAIESWCAQHGKQRPTLLDLHLARKARKKGRR